MKTSRTYSLEWLDSLVSVTLNPARPYRHKLEESDIKTLLEKVPVESQQVQSELIDKLFDLNKERQVRHVVRKYHQALTSLQNLITQYGKSTENDAKQLSELEGLLTVCLLDIKAFMESRFAYYLDNRSNPQAEVTAIGPTKNTGSVSSKYKILCTLSGDQIAIILRGADEAQIIKARSMNAVFKSVIPSLSTEHKENLSVDSIRSKAYNPEEADREAAIQALQKIIKKIQGY